MGLFDQVMGAVSGASSQSLSGDNPILGSIMQLINNPQTGGLGGLIQVFQEKGLGEVVNSWVSTGQNLPVSAEQIQQVLGNDQLKALASQFGVDPGQVSGQLATFLPQIIDQLTPNGSVPAGGDLMTQGLDLIKGRLFG